MADFFLGSAIKFLVGLGLYDVVLPFVFIFTITYATLEKIKIMGGYRNINALIALCFSFTVTASIQFVDGILTFFSVTGLLMVGGVSFLIIIGLFGLQGLPTKGKKWYNKVPHIVVIGGVGLVFAYLALVALGVDKSVFKLVPKLPTVVGEFLIGAIAFLLIIKFIVGNNETTTASTDKKKDKKEALIKDMPAMDKIKTDMPTDTKAIEERKLNEDTTDFNLSSRK